MNERKRYSPLLILLNLWQILKSTFFFVIFLFVLKYGSDSTFIKYGRIAFLLFLGISILSIILKWFTHKYQVDQVSFHMYNGIFNKSERTIPFSKIQNVQRRTSLFHRIFGVTSLSFETGLAGGDATVEFELLTRKEAEEMEAFVANVSTNESIEDEVIIDAVEPIEQLNTKKVHFTPTKKDIFKASFTSLSFILFVPILLSLYSKADDFLKLEKQAEGFLTSLIGTWWLIALIITILIIASVSFGIIRTFFKYGKYEISSDDQKIYITKGVLDESAFTISKNKVQAIEISQSFMKRLLGLAEIKLISAGSAGESSLAKNSLYPFLPVNTAYQMIEELLPSYEVTQTMDRLPKKSFWIRLLKPSWLWMIATIALFYFKPTILKSEQAWWILSIILLLLIVVSRLLDYFNTSYVLNGKYIQFKTGGFTTSVFISKRDKIVEVNISRSKFQQLLGLASIGTINHAQPLYHAGVDDVPLDMASTFYTWYAERINEIEIK